LCVHEFVESAEVIRGCELADVLGNSAGHSSQLRPYCQHHCSQGFVSMITRPMSVGTRTMKPQNIGAGLRCYPFPGSTVDAPRCLWYDRAQQLSGKPSPQTTVARGP